jgi:hypothetical protein
MHFRHFVTRSHQRDPCWSMLELQSGSVAAPTDLNDQANTANKLTEKNPIQPFLNTNTQIEAPSSPQFSPPPGGDRANF